MESGEPGNSGGCAADDLRVADLRLQGAPTDEDGGFGVNDGFEDRGDDAWSKQDDGSFSNVPTAPPTARDERDPQAFGGSTLGNSTGGSWTKSDWPKRYEKPEHQAQWESNTFGNLNHAKMLIQKAQVHHSDNDKTIHPNSKRGRGQSSVVHTMIKKKMSMTNDLIKALEDRHESVEDTIRQVGECLFQLQRAHRSKWAPLNVCERRLELRDTRPLQELVRDHTQEALEHERQTLIESRQELADQIVASKETLINLDKLKGSVIEDLSHKRRGLRTDRSCLSPQAKAKMNAEQDRVVLPQLGEVTNYNLPQTPSKDSDRGGQEESRQVDTKTMLHRAVRMEEDAMKLCNESDAVMLQTKRECQRATAQAQTSIARRAGETDELKRKLEAQMREIDEAIHQTETSLARTQKKLINQELPLKTLDNQLTSLGRTPRGEEGARDPMQEEMEGHLETIKKNVKALTAKFQNTRDLLESLKESRSQLNEDYRNKLSALKIEDACLKVTARKAMELDRMDPRGGRCKVASARKPGKNEGVFSHVAPVPLEAMGQQAALANNDF